MENGSWSSANASEKDSEPSDLTQLAIFQIIKPFYYILGTAIILLNGTLLLLCALRRTVRARLNYFAVFQILTDLQVGLITIPVGIAGQKFQLSPTPIIPTGLCVLTIIWPASIASAVPWSVAVIAVERLIAVKCPFTYKEIVTKKRCALTLVLLVGFILTMNVLPVFDLTPGGSTNVISRCQGHYQQSIGYLEACCCLMVFLPLILNICCYLVTYSVLRRNQASAMQNPETNGDVRPTVGKTLRATNTCLIITIMVSVGWFPYLGFLTILPIFMELFSGLVVTFWYCSLIAFLFAAAVSASNPLVHFFRSETIKQAFKDVFFCQRNQTNRGTVRSGLTDWVSNKLRNRNQVGTLETETSLQTNNSQDAHSFRVNHIHLQPRPSTIDD